MSEEEKKEQQEEETKKDEQNETKTQDDDTPVDTDDTKADETKEELEKLKADNEELRKKLSSQHQPSVVGHQNITTEDQAIQFFSNMTDSDFEQNYAEKFNGKTRDQIISDLKVNKISNQNEQLQARIVLNDTLDDEISKNSRLTKLKGGMKEFFDKFVSNKDKSDTNKIKQHLKDAETYARGKYNMTNTTQPKKSVSTENISPNKDIGTTADTKNEEDDNNMKVSVGSRVMNIQKNKRGHITEYIYDTMEDEPKFN